jgi:hypothetical protein
VLRFALVPALLILTATPALADGDTQSLIATCSAPGLPPDKLDDCLEEVRVAAETGPSPELSALQSKLEQERSAATHPSDALGNPPATAEPPPAAASPPASDGPDADDDDDDKRDTGAAERPVLRPYDPNALPPPNDNSRGR